MEFIKEFLQDWKESFPELEPPNTDFLSSGNLIVQRISESEEKIEEAELLIRKEEFILNWLIALDIDSLVLKDQISGEQNAEHNSISCVDNGLDRNRHNDDNTQAPSVLPENASATQKSAIGIYDEVSHDRSNSNEFSKQDLSAEFPTVTERGQDYTHDVETTQQAHPWRLKQFHSASEESQGRKGMSKVSTADVVRRRHSSDEKYNIQRQHRLNRFYSDRSPKRAEHTVNNTTDSIDTKSRENYSEEAAGNGVVSSSTPSVLPSTSEVDENEGQDISSNPSWTRSKKKLERYYRSSDGRLSTVRDRPKPVLNDVSRVTSDQLYDDSNMVRRESRESLHSHDSCEDDSADGTDGVDDDEEEDVIYVNLQELKLGIHRRLRSRDGSDLSESGDSETGSQTDLHLIHLKEASDQKGEESDDGVDVKKTNDITVDHNVLTTPLPPRYSSSDDALSPQHSKSSEFESITKIKPELFIDDKDHCTRDEKGDKMRKYLVFNLLDSEKCYVDCLDMLCKFMKPLQKSTETSMPILSVADYNKIFFGIDEIFKIHKDFMNTLEPRIEYWDDRQTIGDLFFKLMESFQVYRQFVSNYKGAMETMLKCRNANETFDAIFKKDIKISSLKDSIKLDGLLYKPVDRITQYSLMLNDLLKYTADDHPDRPLLIEVTGSLFDLFETVNVDRSRKGATQRQLLKEGYVVELVDGVRKPRQLFLFSDILMCAKIKPFKEEYNCKWYVSLVDISLKPIKKSEQPQPVPVTVQTDVDKLRASIANTRAELRREQLILAGALSADGSPASKQRKNQSSFSTSSTRGGSNKNLEKLRKKLNEQENVLSLVAPSLPWTIYHTNGKTYTLLLTSDEERHLWKEALSPRIRKMRARDEKSAHLSNYEIHQALETCLKVQRLGARFGSILPSPYIPGKGDKEDGSELLTGFLYVNVHGGKLFGRHDLYCALEVDSYGHFFRKGKTKYCKGPEPVWNEDFEIEIEAARSLRLTCYTRLRLMGDDVCGKVTLDLLKESLGDFRHHSMMLTLDKQGVISLSISFSTTPEGIQRTKSSSEGVFGVPVRVVTRREQFDIPLIVITCVKEVEKRGLEEVGVYRLSGVASEVQSLKKSFDENPQSAVVAVSEADIHAVAGLLKLYFRELPEPLFTDKLYHKFLDGLQLRDIEEKELYMLDLLEQLPRPNKMTALYLMEHLRTVHLKADVNKMNVNNLATVFGPNVLRPSQETEKTRKKSTAGFDIGALDVMSQVSIFRFFLTLKSEKVKLPDDLDIWRRLDPKKAKELEQHLLETAEEYLI